MCYSKDMLRDDALQLLDVHHFAKIETRQKEIKLAHTKRAVPADQDQRAVEEIVAPRQIPSLS